MDLEMKRVKDAGRPAPTWDGYKIEKNPLEAGLAEFGITLQKTDVPQRRKDRQNVLFLGNVLNHFPREEQARELDRIAANMQEGDIVLVQVDDLEASFIEVLQVKGHGTMKTLERVRWINTLAKVEVRTPDRDPGSWRQIYWKPALERISERLTDCLERKLDSPEWRQKNLKTIVLQYLHYFMGTFFRALPVEKTLRIAIREALRRLPAEAGPKGIPVFMGDAKDAYGGALGPDSSPIVSDEELNEMLVASANTERTMADQTSSR
jgi:hypothetical protein